MRWVAALVGILVSAGSAFGQDARARELTLRVTVTDSAARAVSGADVIITRGLQENLGHATTNEAGEASLVLGRLEGEVQVSVRKIGYQRADQFLRVTDSTAGKALRITLHRTVQQLDVVQVSADADLKRKSYHADADDIANSKRPLFDGFDILTKLRPDMLFGREGPHGACIVHDVWVNGRHIVLPVITAMDRARHSRLPKDPMSKIPIAVEATMRTIKPEHIAEVNYADCYNTSVVRPGAQNAVFVSLKPGIAYEPGRGSYVLDDAPAPTRTIASYRTRVLGVFDAMSGDPVDGVAVRDSSTGIVATTTATGTVSLAFLPDGSSALQITKAGYLPLRLDVSISPRDTLPITLVLERAK